MSDIPAETKIWILKNFADKEVKLTGSDATFELQTQKLPSPIPGDSLLLEALYFSNDPAQRIWLQKDSKVNWSESMLGGVSLGAGVLSYGIFRVLVVGGESPEEEFKQGDLVLSWAFWAEYAVVKKSLCSVINVTPGMSPTLWLGVLGLSGISAYWGLTAILYPKQSDTLVVSGAAGAVGNVVVQYAKNVLGLKRVIGVAGTEEKCAWLRTIGADATVNYKSSSLLRDLEEASPDGIDLFFDNTSGPILDAVIERMNANGRIALCGSISTYNDISSASVKNYSLLLFRMKQLTLLGFNLEAFLERTTEALDALMGAMREKKLSAEGGETIYDLRRRFEDIPRVWGELFEGGNCGKSIIKIAD